MPTIDHSLQKPVRGSFNPTDRLIVEYNHVPPHGDSGTCQRKNRICHVLLPEMADEVNRTQDLQGLQRGLILQVGVREHSRGPSDGMDCQPTKEEKWTTHVSRAT